MSWYYAAGQERRGPLTDAEFEMLVSGGAITPDTLVWRNGMAGWQRYRELEGVAASEPKNAVGEPLGPNERACAECGRAFSVEDMILYNDRWVCAACKPAFFQRLKEGIVSGQLSYGGFWIRFLAVMIDGLITTIPIAVFFFAYTASRSQVPDFAMLFQLSFSLGGSVLTLVYETFFIGKYGATPGKMVCGLKVQRSNGDRLTYLRALARHLAKIVSSLILNIGYIMAGFDDEKRALHDLMCDTRVVRT